MSKAESLQKIGPMDQTIDRYIAQRKGDSMDAALRTRRAQIQTQLEQRLDWVRQRIHALERIEALLRDMRTIAEAAAQPLMTVDDRQRLDATFHYLQQQISEWEEQSISLVPPQQTTQH